MDVILALVDCYQQHRHHGHVKNHAVSLLSRSTSISSSLSLRKAKVSPKRKTRPSSESYLAASENGTPVADVATPKL